MPSEKLTDLQRAVIEHDDDMARLVRNTMPTPETSITVEAANKSRADLAKESRLLREWLDFLDRAIDDNTVIHWALVHSINESCAKLTYLAGRVNEDLLK